MNEEFIPANGNGAVAVVSDEMRASLELVKVAQDARFLECIAKATTLKVLEGFSRIEDDEQYEQAINAFDACKKAIRELETLRKEYVAFPTKVVSLVNATFKTVRDGLTGTKEHTGKMIDVRKQADLELNRQRLEEAREVSEEPVQTTDEAGVTTVQFEPVVPEAPSNVVESVKGAKVHSRSETVVTVVSKAAFVRAVMGKNKRNEWMTKHAEEVLQVNMTLVKEIVKDNKKRKFPGLKVETKTRTV